MRFGTREQHFVLAVVALGVLSAMGWRGADISYAVVGVVAAVVAPHAASDWMYNGRRPGVPTPSPSSPATPAPTGKTGWTV